MKKIEPTLTQLFEHSTDIVYRVGADGLIKYLSPGFTRLTGWSVDEWVGGQFTDLIADDDRERALEALRSRTNADNPVPAVFHIKTKEGGTRVIESNGVAIREPGQPIEVAGVARDVTNRQLIEDELARRNRQVLHILESITDGFYLLDNDWRYVMLNQAAQDLAGNDREELLGKVIWDVRSKRTVDVLSKKFHRAKESGKPLVFEEAYPDSHKWFEIRVYPHADGLAVYFTDISIRKRAETELKKQSEGVEKIITEILGIQEKWS